MYFGHINFRDLMSFSIDWYANVLLQQRSLPSVRKQGAAISCVESFL